MTKPDPAHAWQVYTDLLNKRTVERNDPDGTR